MSSHRSSTDPADARVEGLELDADVLHAFVEEAVRLSYRLHSRLSEDDLQDGALKWWARLASGPVPVYLIDEGRLSPALLAYWIRRSADEARIEREIRESRLRRAGHKIVSTSDPECESYDAGDRTDTPLAEGVVDRVHAAELAALLGPVGELDEVLRYRALDCSYDEIGDIVGIRPATARVRKLRAAARIAARLDAVA
jgi:DNA-directed RNA polymerase specialized sigma24 family protein